VTAWLHSRTNGFKRWRKS